MNADEWLELGRERASDAQAVLERRPNSVGSVYLAGYGIECSIKAYLQQTRRPVITSGAAGHDLKQLWKSCGLQKSDVGGTEGSRTFFLEQWAVDLRYVISQDFGGQRHKELVEGAKKITGWLHQQVRRQKLRRRK